MVEIVKPNLIPPLCPVCPFMNTMIQSVETMRCIGNDEATLTKVVFKCEKVKQQGGVVIGGRKTVPATVIVAKGTATYKLDDAEMTSNLDPVTADCPAYPVKTSFTHKDWGHLYRSRQKRDS